MIQICYNESEINHSLQFILQVYSYFNYYFPHNSFSNIHQKQCSFQQHAGNHFSFHAVENSSVEGVAMLAIITYFIVAFMLVYHIFH